MTRVKIGFVPSHRHPPMNTDWAVRMRERTIKALGKVEGLQLVVPSEKLTENGLVRSVEEGQKTLELFKKENVAGVIIGCMTFGHEKSAVGVIAAGLPEGTPVLHFATKGNVNPDGTRPSDSWCGSFMIASALKRRGIVSEHIPTCFPEEPVFGKWAARFVKACAATQGFRGAKIGQVGVRPEEFESVWCDEASMQKAFNQTVVPIDLDNFFNRVKSMKSQDPGLAKTKREITAGIESRISAESLETIARFEVALARFAAEKGLAAIAVNCWPMVFERLKICACSSLGRATDKGIMCACEVDVYGAASMVAAYQAALGKAVPHFIDWTDLHPDKKDVFLAWHCGNAPGSLCKVGCKPCLREHSMSPLKLEGTLEFSYEPGRVTCSRLVEYDGEFAMFIGEAEVVDIKPGTRGSYGWVKVKDLQDWEDKMIENGVIHHGVLIHDEQAGALESFCKFNGIRVIRAA